MIEPDVFEARTEDYSLTAEQSDLARSFGQFLVRACPPERVRGAEATGFDAELWQRMCEQGAVAMAVLGDDAASLLDLTLVAEEVGAVMAPVPYVDSVVAVRLLGRLAETYDGPTNLNDLIELASEGERITVFTPAKAGVANVGSATHVLRFVNDKLVLAERDQSASALANVASLALVPLDDAVAGETLIEGDAARAAFDLARDEWRVLTAATLVGLIRTVQTIAVEFAKTRRTRGLTIGALQGVAFPLADTEIARETAQHLTRRAAWYLEHEPHSHPELPPAALIHALRSARRSAETGVHTLAGLGVSLESDMTLAFRRAQAWVLAGEKPSDLANYIGDLVARPAVG